MTGKLRLTYVGHATVLIELDGVRILTDPTLRRRVGPLLRRGTIPMPEELGPIDAALVSHSHADHFDPASIRAIRGDPLLVVPRGVGRAAAETGRPTLEVVANDHFDVGPVRITAVPARHRGSITYRGERPVGFLIEGSTGIYFAGDTALFREMAGLAGRVDVALLPVGRWGPPVGPSRLGPTSAVEAAMLVGASAAIPIHWGTIYIPGFARGHAGWGSLRAGELFAGEAARLAPDLAVTVLGPGEAREFGGWSRSGEGD